MAWFNANLSNSGGGGEGHIISLANNYKIGLDATYEHNSPYNANNYVEVSGTTVTLKRNNNSCHLFIYTPILEVGKVYAIVFDGITNSDNNYYMQKITSSLSVNPLVTTRFDTIGHGSALINGIAIKPDANTSYGIAIWSNNTSDISILNPRLIY
jgi:hypothetical protein